MLSYNAWVDVFYADRQVAKICASEKKMVQKYGKVRANKLAARLQQLRVAESLADLRLVTGRCHELSADRAGQLALDLDGAVRLVFEPDGGEVDEHGQLLWESVESVVILEIVDYH